jgi:hypothetical protein
MTLLLNNNNLEQSSVVANSTMNRERVCAGGNSYSKELSLNILEFLSNRLNSQDKVSWLDICCGREKL